jgi:hypothetical protein
MISLIKRTAQNIKMIFMKNNIYDSFQAVYDNFIWDNHGNDGESRSGAGSTIKNTEQIRTSLVSLIKELNIKKCLMLVVVIGIG